MAGWKRRTPPTNDGHFLSSRFYPYILKTGPNASVSEKMEQSLRGCLTMSAFHVLLYHQRARGGMRGDHNGCRQCHCEDYRSRFRRELQLRGELHSMEGTDGCWLSCNLSPKISHALTNVVNGGPVCSHVTTRRMSFFSGLRKMIQSQLASHLLGKRGQDEAVIKNTFIMTKLILL